LLLQTGPHFERAYRNDPAFYLVSSVAEYTPLRSERGWLAALLLVTLIILMSTNYVPILISAALIALLMVATGCLSTSEARRSIEWQTLIVIAAAFGVGKALENSGAAAGVARAFVEMTGGSGPWVALSLTYLLVSLVTEVITNNAAAVLMFPICLETARIYNVSERPFLMALVLAASAAFMTPIGYQTNMMVYGPGGYKFADFLKVGAPLNFTLWMLSTFLIPLIWPF
jgi:di/tricarboxylate transporter